MVVIVAFHNARPVQRFLAPREEGLALRTGRWALALFLTGVMIEIALTPIVLFHFHRAGLYGAFANVLAIPLVTFISMPLIALALLLDLAGLGGPVWWLVGRSLSLMLGIARFTAEQPGAIKLVPHIGTAALCLFVGGGLWIALWHGAMRVWGLIPIAGSLAMMVMAPTPDILISRDGRHIAFVGEGDRLLSLRDTSSDYVRDSMQEMAAFEGEPLILSEWPNARCSADFCVLPFERGGRYWQVLMSLSDMIVEERALAAACEAADIVISDRGLPSSCRPRWLKADRRYLAKEGGLAIYLSGARAKLETVRETQGEHGWWRGPDR